MKTEIPLPDQIKFADTQSEMNWNQISQGKITRGLIVITGPKGKGKTRLASAIAGSRDYCLLPSEKKLSDLLDQPAPIAKYFDEITITKGRSAINSSAISEAQAYKLIILSGEHVNLCTALERRAIRINLA